MRPQVNLREPQVEMMSDEEGLEAQVIPDVSDLEEVPQRIAVDVDNTLTRGGKRYWKEMCDPDQEMIEKVNELYKQGHTIIIWTARPWKVAPQLKAFLERYQVRHHGIMMGKGSADRYIDDKAVRPEAVKNED